MEQLKNQIQEYLKNQNIEVLHFNTINDNSAIQKQTFELAIKVNKNDLEKWEYFIKRVNEIITDDIYFASNTRSDQNMMLRLRKRPTYNVITQQFNDNTLFFRLDISKILKENIRLDNLLYNCLSGFYKGLQKKYHLISPKLDYLYIMFKVTHRCNLDCKYCYDKEHRQDMHCDMSMELFDRMLELASKYTRSIIVTYHGGEPTVVGRGWYEKVHEEIIPKYPMLDMTFRLQSNGVVLNQEWFDMFEKYGIFTGISYNANYQDHLRVINQLNDDEKKDKEVGDKVLDILKSDMFNSGVIDVVTKYNYKNMIDTYEFYKNMNLGVSLTPCYSSPDAEKNDLELDVDDYITEYKKFFKYWLYDKNGREEIVAKNLLKVVVGSKHSLCEYNGCFTRPSLCVEPTGETVLCGRHWPKEYYFGSVFDYDSYEDIYKSDGYKLYCEETQSRMDNCKQTCDYYDVCHGGCTVRHIADTHKCSERSEEFCKLTKEQFNATYEVLRDVDLVRDKLNPAAKRLLIQNDFYSVMEIKQILQEAGVNIPLEYNPNDLMKCSEYQVFKGVNYEAMRSKYQRRIDIIDSLEEKAIERNLQARKRDLIDYFRNVARYEKEA